jgi:hypothetical protein
MHLVEKGWLNYWLKKMIIGGNKLSLCGWQIVICIPSIFTQLHQVENK